MISNPLHGIQADVAAAIERLIPDGDDFGWDGNNVYHSTHKRRYAKTLDILFDGKTSVAGAKILEIATSAVLPVAIYEIESDVDITVTNFDLSGKKSGTYKVSHADKEYELPAYFVDLESTKLPAKDSTFDTILCCEVLEHMDVDPMFMLAELNRVLKPGGRLILTTPNITSSHALWKMLRGIEPYFFMQYHKDRSPYRHNYEYSHGGLTALLTAAGFEGDIWTEDSFEDGISDDAEFLERAGFKVNTDLLGDNLFASVYKVSDVVERYPSPIYV